MSFHYRRARNAGGWTFSVAKVIQCSLIVLTTVCILNIILLTFGTAGILAEFEEDSTSIIDLSTLPSKSVPQSTRSHHCINSDFQPTHKTSVWTMLNDNPAYIKSALKLGRALKKHTTKTDFDLVVMTLKNKPLSQESMSQLAQIGYTNCIIDPIRPTHLEGKTRKDLQEKFGVLHVFSMTVYDTVLFMDADTFVKGPIDDLLSMDLHGKTIGVTKDIRSRKWVESFNTGVMLLHPSIDTYTHLVALLNDESFEFEYIMSDQGFLNAVYKDNWHEIGFVYNANLALYRFQREFWDQHDMKDVQIIHYTMQKPWKCKANGPYGPICRLWIDAD